MPDIPTAVYAYCIVSLARRPPVARAPAGLRGGSRPEAYSLPGSLWLIAAEVPLAMYAPENLEPRLRDLDWVSEAAVAHEKVVEHFSRMRGAAVVPMKLFTMFSSLSRAIDETEQGRRAIERVVRRVAGCEEWGVRIVRKPAAVSRRSGRAEGSGRRTGAAFLAARKEARDAAATARFASLQAADEAFDRLRRQARDAYRRDRRPEPGTNPPILEAAFLVPTGKRERFKTEAQRQARAVAKAGAELALTGPWPAYNFVGRVDGGER